MNNWNKLANSGDTTGTSEAASIILNSRNKTDADRLLQDERYDRINQLLKEKNAHLVFEIVWF